MNKISKPSLKSQFSISLQKHKPVRAEVEKFEQKLQEFIANINPQESEEHNKNWIIKFFNETFYQNNPVNTYKRKDLAIYSKNNSKIPELLIEAKKPLVRSEMPTVKNLDSKALQELLYYFLEETIENKNLEIKNLIITDCYEWFIFDSLEFNKVFQLDKELIRNFKNFKEKSLIGDSTTDFYKLIASPAIQRNQDKLNYLYFDLKPTKPKIVDLYKLFSPYFLLKKPLGNDSNELNKEFYHELLYIMGLEEKTEAGKKIITRTSRRQPGTLLENLIEQIQIKNAISDSQELFETALAIVILWINRILFLKLLEGQLVSFNKSNDYKFLTTQKISDYDELNNLFFQVLAITEDQRIARMKDKFALVPYLNSSLFEYSQIEKEYSAINGLTDKIELPVYAHTVLKDQNNKRLTKSLPPLEYLLSFLDSYDFGSESKTDTETVEESKTIINASVLGLIFEKINGYKDGSFFTPGFITSYMARKTVEKAIIAKFNQHENNQIESFEDLKNYTRKYFKTEDLELISIF